MAKEIVNQSKIDLISRKLVTNNYNLEDINIILENLEIVADLKEIIQTHGKIQCPLQDRIRQMWMVLADLASQENCDGEPYDQMQEATDYIRKIENLIREDE